MCSDCDDTMTSYLNKAKNIYYYKCNSCHKTVNASSSKKSLRAGLHEQFGDVLEEFNFSKKTMKPKLIQQALQQLKTHNL